MDLQALTHGNSGIREHLRDSQVRDHLPATTEAQRSPARASAAGDRFRSGGKNCERPGSGSSARIIAGYRHRIVTNFSLEGYGTAGSELPSRVCAALLARCAAR